MLLALTAALLPLGLIALFASIQSDHAKRVQREVAAQVVATSEARQIDILLLRGASILRGVLAIGDLDPDRCRLLLARNAAGFPRPIDLAVFDRNGELRCATPGFRDPNGAPLRHDGFALAFMKAPAALRFSVGGAGGAYGVGFLPVPLLRGVLPPDDGAHGIVLVQGDVRLPLATLTHAPLLGRQLTLAAPIGGARARLYLTITANPFNAVELLLVLLPLLMWAAAAAIGWIVVDHLLLRPLAQLQHAVASYHPGTGVLTLPRISTPSGEIRALGEAFRQVAEELVSRGVALEQGLNQQVRLTREVHHRVKNNLQVVASLINLHARGTEGPVAAAYASIQRRVDALAVVHRNHYAEIEENRGVALRAIVAELAANLRATAPPDASRLSIGLNMIPVFVTQDVAVPVAFLVTEVVELAMQCDPSGQVSIALTAADMPDRALLSIGAHGLADHICLEHPNRERFQRIVTGLSRQLRSQLDYRPGEGLYRILIAVLPPVTDADETQEKS